MVDVDGMDGWMGKMNRMDRNLSFTKVLLYS